MLLFGCNGSAMQDIMIRVKTSHHKTLGWPKPKRNELDKCKYCGKTNFISTKYWYCYICQLQTRICWLSNAWLNAEDDEQLPLVKDISRAFSWSLAKPLLINEIMYSMDRASMGSVIGPSVGIPNSSSDALKSPLMMLLLRYERGMAKRLSSIV